VLNELKRYEEAQVANNQALALDPNDAVAWYSKGIVYRGLGRMREAKEAERRAKELNPDYAATPKPSPAVTPISSDDSIVSRTRSLLSRRSLLRRGGIATGVFLTALTGITLLAVHIIQVNQSPTSTSPLSATPAVVTLTKAASKGASAYVTVKNNAAGPVALQATAGSPGSA